MATPIEAPMATVNTEARRISWASLLIIAIIAVYSVFLMFWRLDVYPAPSFDEGAFLKVAKNYALTGNYADFSLGEERFTGAVVSTGPTVILPVAIVYKIFGPSIALGRVVSGLYTLSLLAMILWLGYAFADIRLGICAVILIVCSPNISLEFYGRSLLGEIPGLFLMFVALWLWIRAKKHNYQDLIVVGIVFGLSAITKNQYAPIILGGIFIAWMANIFWYKTRGVLYYVIPGGVAGLVYAGWTYYVLFLLGAQTRDVAADIAFLRSTTASSLILFNSIINNNNLTALIQDVPLLIPALIYGLVAALRRDEKEQDWANVTLFLAISAVMFVFSTGWERYELAPQVIGVLVIARLLHTMTNGFTIKWSEVRDLLAGRGLSRDLAIMIAVFTLLVALLLRPTYIQTKDILTSGTSAPYVVQNYLNTSIPLTATIATYESDLGVLTNHAYKFPPNPVVVDLTVKKPAGLAYNATYIDYLLTQKADYIVIGHFAKTFGLYIPDHLTAKYKLIFTAGEYDVYQSKDASF
jgi:hypothetical protein